MQDLRKEEAADLQQRKVSIKSKVKRAGNAIAKMSFLPYTPAKADLTGLDGFSKLSLTIHAKNKMKKYKAPKSATKNNRKKSILKKKRSSKNISEIEIPHEITEISEILNLRLNQTLIDLNETIQELLHTSKR